MSKRHVAKRPIRILLQTTIPATADDWSIERFSLLNEHLASLKDATGRPLCEVIARNREEDINGDDPVLSALDRSDFDELWLFAVDVGNGLSPNDCAGITRFRQRSGGILAARDHQDLGSSLCLIGGIGAAHLFHTRNPDPDLSRCAPDDTETKSISWPNYHSGRNGDYQLITPVQPVHQLLRKSDAPGAITHFPAHPHEGSVAAPPGEQNARVIATGRSQTTNRPFNLVVAFENTPESSGERMLGRGIAESSFHHFADYNWDTEKGAPSFVEEAPGDGIKREPGDLNDIKTYVRNLAIWLAPLTRRVDGTNDLS